MNLSLEALKEALHIHETIASLEARLEKILGGGGAGAPDPFIKTASVSPIVKKGRKKMSASARARIAAAKKAWWAARKGTSSGARPATKKGGITDEGRARLAAAMKARWAARKKGAPALNARKKK